MLQFESLWVSLFSLSLYFCMPILALLVEPSKVDQFFPSLGYCVSHLLAPLPESLLEQDFVRFITSLGTSEPNACAYLV